MKLSKLIIICILLKFGAICACPIGSCMNDPNNIASKKMVQSPMQQLYTNTIQKEKSQASYDYVASWANDKSRFVVTLCNGDTEKENNKKFNIHVPVDNVVIRVVHRKQNLSELEHTASMHALDIISTIPTNSFMIVCRVQTQHAEELHQIGNCAKNDNGYWELSLKVGHFKNLADMRADETSKDYIVVLTYVVPVILMPQGSIVLSLQDKMRNDANMHVENILKRLPLTNWSPNMDIDMAEEGWHTEKTSIINEMAEHVHIVDNVRKNLFGEVEMNIDNALSVYKTWSTAKKYSRSDEILRDYCKDKIQPQEPPALWPKRLIDVRMNALVPGENIWYFRGSFNALSYTWDTGNKTLYTNARPFSSSRTVSTHKKNAYSDLLETVKTVDASEYLWIDALCIDQTNEDEKIAEVRRSPEYYKKCNKCIVFPSGLSHDTDITELSGPILPRWFQRAWTLQEAASARFIVGRFLANGKISYLDRFEIVRHLDDNTQQSGLIISSARQIMRREGLDALNPVTIVEWALAREAEKVQDIIYGTASMFQENVGNKIVGNYSTCMRCVIINLARTMCGKDRTSLAALTGKGWLPRLLHKDDLAGITTESELDSYVQDDGSLLIKGTIAYKVKNVTLYGKTPHIGDDYRRYSQSKSKRFHVEELAIMYSQARNDRKYAGDNAAARAWVAITYMSSDILELLYDSGKKVTRIISLDDTKFSHLIFLGYAKESVYLERVYICATLRDDGIFDKKGILAEPVGKVVNNNENRADVVLAEGSSCSCHAYKSYA